MSTSVEIEMVIQLPNSEPELITFNSEHVISAKLIDEIDPITLQLPSAEFTFRVYTEDERFNVINGEFSSLITQNQRISIKAKHNNDIVFVGTYYTSEYSAISDYLYEFKCVNIIGLMDTLKFEGLFLPEQTEPEEVIDSVLTKYNIPFELGEFGNRKIRGWLATGSVRDAIHQIVCAIGGVVTTLENGGIRITLSKLGFITGSPDYFIPRRLKLDSQKVIREPMVSSVSVTTREYINMDGLAIQKEILFEQHLGVGTHNILFEKPCFDLVISWFLTPPGTPPEQRIPVSPDYQGTVIFEHHKAVIEVEYPCTVVIEGHEWRHYSREIGVENENSDSIRLRNDVMIEGITLGDVWASSRILSNAVKRYFLLEYIQEVQIIRTKEYVNLALGAQYGGKEYGNFYYVADGEAHEGLSTINVNSTVDVETLNNKTVRGIVEQMELDLVGGMIAKLKIRCFELEE